MKASNLLLLAFGLFSTTVAQAQQAASQFPQPVQSPSLVQNHASTAAEGWFRGTADRIRAWGEYNYNSAAAALILQEARKARYANELLHAETFHAKRSIHDTHMAASKSRRLTHPTAKPEAEQIAHRVPSPFVAPSQPGFIWPAALYHPAFDGSREKLAGLFSQRSLADSGPQSVNYLRIQNTTADMRTLLTGLVRELPGMAYIEARHFLDRADYAARQPVPEMLAAGAGAPGPGPIAGNNSTATPFVARNPGAPAGPIGGGNNTATPFIAPGNGGGVAGGNRTASPNLAPVGNAGGNQTRFPFVARNPGAPAGPIGGGNNTATPFIAPGNGGGVAGGNRTASPNLAPVGNAGGNRARSPFVAPQRGR